MTHPVIVLNIAGNLLGRPRGPPGSKVVDHEAPRDERAVVSTRLGRLSSLRAPGLPHEREDSLAGNPMRPSKK